MSKKTEIAVNARYRHHTGRIYIVEGIYREEDLGVEFVAHRGEHDERGWVRTVSNFLGQKDGVQRFTLAAG